MKDTRPYEFAHLYTTGLTYLDYTGAAIPSASQIAAHDALLKSAVLGNPHSENAPSRASSAILEHARERVLRFFNADPAEYVVCFVANASAAIKLVAESFPFGPESRLALTADNHNSMNGIRAFARRAGATCDTLPLDEELRLADPLAHLTPVPAPSLFGFPAQSNFSGVRHPLSLIKAARKRGYSVLLDAASYAPTSPLDLRAISPDFVALSFYKMFGIPTGVGALIARRESLAALTRPWFAGGTVDWVSVQLQQHRLRASLDGFEDGTPNYYGVAAVAAGLDFLDRLTMQCVADHTKAMTSLLLSRLANARNAAGDASFAVYGPASDADRGGTVAANLLDGDGNVLPYEQIEVRAREENVAIRGGCFCNPGAAEAAFGFSAERTQACFTALQHESFTPRALGNCLGGSIPVGAIRISVGVPTTPADIDRAVDVLTALGAA